MSTQNDQEILSSWYRFAAQQQGFVDSFLQLLRDQFGKSLAEQQREFGAGESEFLRLRGMRLPRPNAFTSDAQRMATACQLSNPIAFVRALVLARNLSNMNPNSGTGTGYQAAFDATDDLDTPPETE